MTSSEVIPLFSSPICINTFELDDNEVESIKQEKYKDITSDISKYDGHISYDENIFQNYPKLKDICLKHMDSFIYDVLKITRNAKFNIIKSWANLHQPNHSAHAHSHANSMFSGVLYLDTPKDSGAILFDAQNHPTWSTRTIEPKLDEHTIINSRSYRIEPHRGMSIVFPSHMSHSVELNNSGQNRYSLAYDVMMWW